MISRLAVLVSFWLAVWAARADYETTFSPPLYGMDQSVSGIDGWAYRLAGNNGDSESARVVAVRWNNRKPALMIKGASLKNAFAPTAGEKVTITFDLALTFPDMRGARKQFRFGLIGAPCGEFFMDLSAEGGLGYGADGSGNGGIVALAKGEVKVNSFYTCMVIVDYTKKVYHLSITGQKRDDSLFNYSVRDVAFESKATNVSAIYIISGKALTAYLSSMAIRSE